MPLSYEDGYLLDPLQQGFLLAIRYIFFSPFQFSALLTRNLVFLSSNLRDFRSDSGERTIKRKESTRKSRKLEKSGENSSMDRDILTERAEFLTAKIHERVKDSDLRSILRCLMNERRVEGEQVKR